MSGSIPTVCVAIPVRDGSDWLAESIESVLAQDVPGLSLLVVDNLSNDDSFGIAGRYAERDARVSVVRNLRDVGYYGSLNLALHATSANYFVPFAHDDLMAPGNLARKIGLLEQHEAGLAHSSAELVTGDLRPIGVQPDHTGLPEVSAPTEFFERLVPCNGINCQSVVVRAAALRAVGGFDARTTYAADWLAWSRIALRWPVITIAEPLLIRREHQGTGTNVCNERGIEARDVPATLDALLRDSCVPDRYLDARPRFVAYACMNSAVLLEQSGRRRLAEGWAAYMMIGRALAEVPNDPQLRAGYEQFAINAGLVPPDRSGRCAARMPSDADEAALLIAAAIGLGPLCRTLVIGVDGVEANAAIALLAPLVPDDLDVELVPGATDEQLFSTGRLAIARWGADEVPTAERHGVPVHPYAIPNPFPEAGDPFADFDHPFNHQGDPYERIPPLDDVLDFGIYPYGRQAA